MDDFTDIFPAMICPARWDKLMVCTDGSVGGNNAVAVTLELGQACGSKVVVVQALEVMPEYQAVIPDLRGTLGREAETNMEFIQSEATKLGVPVEPVILQGQAAPGAIVALAEKICPDLLIMGRRGKHAFPRILMGSVTARVIGQSPVNVLVVPRGAAVAFHRLLIASDGSSFSEAAWELALSMAKQAASQLIGVAVAQEEGDIIEAKAIVHKMLVDANQAGMPLKGVSPQGVAPDAGIVHQAIKNEVDLIIMGSYGRTGLKKLFMGSVTERVIGKTPCPVLVVKKKN
jgi:nucleotide-binding universal stress UspA family protein